MMWNTWLVLAIICVAVVGIIIVGKDDEFWDEEEDDTPNT